MRSTASHIHMCNFPREPFVRDRNITGSQLPLARPGLVRPRALSLLEKLPRVTYSTSDGAAVHLRDSPRRRFGSTDFGSNVFQGGREGTVFLSPSFSSPLPYLCLSFSSPSHPFLSLTRSVAQMHENARSFSITPSLFLSSFILSSIGQHPFCFPMSLTFPCLPTSSYILLLNLSPCFISTVRPSKEIGYSVSYQHCRN